MARTADYNFLIRRIIMNLRFILFMEKEVFLCAGMRGVGSMN